MPIRPSKRPLHRTHELDLIAKKMDQEIESDSEALADQVMGEVMPGMAQMQPGQGREMIRQQWARQSFRELLLQRYGARRFLEIVNDTFKADPSVGSREELVEEGTKRLEAMLGQQDEEPDEELAGAREALRRSFVEHDQRGTY